MTEAVAPEHCLWVPVRSVFGRYSAWPAERAVPTGWQPAGSRADRDTAFALAAEHWAATRPALPALSPATLDTVDRRFFAVARQQPDRTAAVENGLTYSYAQLASLTTSIRGGLWRLGLRPGDVAGVCMGRSAEMIATLLAILSCGAAYVPMDGNYPAARLGFIADDVGLRCVVADPGYLDLLGSLGRPVVTTRDLRSAPGQELPPRSRRPGSLAYVIYTSGSTGTPKGVEVEHANLVSFLDAITELLPATAARQVLFSTPLTFDIAGLEIFWPLARGGSCLIAPSTWLMSATRLVKLINTAHPSLVQATPTGWRLLLDAGARPQPGSVVLCGGEELPAGLATVLARLPADSYNLYGPTEATIWALSARITEGPVTIGTAMSHVQAYILDDHLRPVPEGAEGELYLGGPAVTGGYRGRPRLTAERFLPDPSAPQPGQPMYASGDMARSIGGQLRWLRRKDTQVKVNGHRIELGEIETVALSVETVAAAVAVVRAAGQSGGSSVWLYLESDQPAVGACVQQLLRQRLPAAMVPARVIVLRTLPLTANGKVDRVALSAGITSR
jgi:amino acid adenylation domain-containing protein